MTQKESVNMVRNCVNAMLKITQAKIAMLETGTCMDELDEALAALGAVKEPEPVARVHTFIGSAWAVVEVLGDFHLEDSLYTAPPTSET